MELIDKDALVAKIERLKNVLSDPLMKINGVDYITGGKKIIKEMEFFLNSLKVKDVDLEKVFNDEYSKFSNDVGVDYCFPIDLADYKDFAKHFFELGLKAQKGK